MGQAPVVDSVVVNPAVAIPGVPNAVTCNAHDPDGLVTQVQFLASGGTFDDAAPAVSPAAGVSVTARWTPPSTGTYTITCTVWDDGVGFLRAKGSLAVAVDAAPGAQPPVIDSLTSSATVLLPGQTAHLTVAAHDPSGGAVSLAWGASSGPLTAAGATADGLAPDAGGDFVVSVQATNPSGLSASAQLSLAVRLRTFDGVYATEVQAPRRLAAAPNGGAYVVDARSGQVLFTTAKGGVMGAAALDEAVAAVAAGAGRLFAVTARGRILEIDGQAGRQVGAVVPAGGPAVGPSGLAFAPAAGLLFVAERAAGRVRALRLDGSAAFTLSSAGGAPLAAPVDVAVDGPNGLLWVLLEGSAGGKLLHAFRFDGTWVRSQVDPGGGAGELTRGGGLAVEASGRLFVSDTFQGVVQTYDAAGAWSGSVGAWARARASCGSPQASSPMRAGTCSSPTSAPAASSASAPACPRPSVPATATATACRTPGRSPTASTPPGPATLSSTRTAMAS